MHSEQIREYAKGKWQAILPEFGIDRKYLNNRHGPCPLCGGKDRWRFDDRDGLGTYFCSNCGAGDGFTLLSKKTKMPFADIAFRNRNLSNLTIEYKQVRHFSEEELLRRMRMLWERAGVISATDPVGKYLSSRGVASMALQMPSSVLRIAKDIVYPDTRLQCFALLSKVITPNNRAVNVHITYVDEHGNKVGRRVMQGSLPEGSAVRLGSENQVMGIAEGIETALSASILFNMPVWAALNANQLAKWIPPKVCQEVHVFADHDLSFTGQYKAYELAYNIKRQGLAVTVHLPIVPDTDWNDQLLSKDS